MICFHGEVILPDLLLRNAWVLCDGGRIISVTERRPAAASGAEVVEGRYIAPGYVDIHVHGGGGADYMDGTAEAVRTANRAHTRHGTTTILPTTTTGSPEEIQRMLQAVGEAREKWTIADGARIGGVHYYGPYFAPDKVGCHSVEGRRDPVPAEYLDALATGLIRVATCAAELPGAEEFCRAAKAAGCLVTCGHSNSDWSEMVRAFDAGMRHVDHYWSAMSSVTSLRARFGVPMRASMAEFVLAYPDMSTEVIADGSHLSPELLDFAYRMKGALRLLLVTDANRALDMPEGRYRFGPEKEDGSGTWFINNGKVGMTDDGGLASSIMGMDHMVRTMKAGTSATLYDVVRMASLTPAERLGLADRIGSLEEGKSADVLVLDGDLQVQRVFVEGEEFRA